ncbi:MAG: sodium:solute symporter family protein [Terriglobia bacterium]|nr:sodium:solute symporter family protein [Terriglobia bacterium]
MTFTFLDWGAIAAYLLITLLLGLYFKSRSGKSVDDYFVSGRNVTWWLAGTSMVATTFAADTPLLVTGLVYRQGIAGNWIWWSFLLSGMMTVFLFARLWRRSGLLTDVQFAEMRYAGKPAAFLRGFRAIYLGLLMNCLILGWVTKAMVSILGVTFQISDFKALLICVLFLIPFTGFYVALGGLWGVLWTDLFQFVLKMGIVIAVAFYAVHAIGGMDVMLSRLSSMRATNGASDPLALFPDFSHGFTSENLWTLPVITFVVFLGVQWWAFWYPGAEPGGGGYIAQRIFSAKDEKNGLLSVLWFNFAHYAVRPWPWILTGLAVIVLHPELRAPGANPEAGYMMVLNEHLPHAWRGVAMAGFLAAFMSTIATHLNWGASYLVSDFYRRFIKKDASERHYVHISRLTTVILVCAAAVVAALLTSIKSGWEFVLELGAGTGIVYLLRWYWWRINAWSEISAMATAMVVSLSLRIWQFLGMRGTVAPPFTGSDAVVFAKTAITTTLCTTIVAIAVTLLTSAEPEPVLRAFYRKVHPDVRGWKPIAALETQIAQTRDIGRNLLSWILGCALIYLALFGTGKFILNQRGLGSLMLVGSLICGFLLYKEQSARNWGASAAEAVADLSADVATGKH